MMLSNVSAAHVAPRPLPLAPAPQPPSPAARGREIHHALRRGMHGVMGELRDLRRTLREEGRGPDAPDTREARRDVRELERAFRRDLHGLRDGGTAGEELLEGLRASAGVLVAGLRDAVGAGRETEAERDDSAPEAARVEPAVAAYTEARASLEDAPAALDLVG